MGVEWCERLRRARVWSRECLYELYQGKISNSFGRDGRWNLYRYGFTVIDDATFVFVSISWKSIAMANSIIRFRR